MGPPRGAHPTRLIGRANECRQIERLLVDARAGHSGTLVARGEPGIGKSALLEHAVLSADDFLVTRATGVETEMELPFAGLHQLCAPMIDRLALLPDPQREAMSVAFGLSTGRPPNRLLVGLALLSLLSEMSHDTPLVCVVDDAHWLDAASTHALGFVARRLLAERVCLLLGTRRMLEDFNGLPQLVVAGLSDRDARALLASVLHGPLDDRVRDRIIAETHGNPLALLEWPRGLSPAELAVGFGLPALPMAGQIEEGFRRRLEELPAPAQRFLTVAAAEPTGDAMLVWRAASELGVTGHDASPAIEAGLVEVGARVSFRHPTVRSAAYAAAGVEDRRSAHRALADVTDPAADPDRRAWHLALATPGPDEDVAAVLERSAGRAQARGGLAAAAAMLERSAALTLDPAKRAHRTIAAASAYLEAGASEAAATLLAAAEAGPLDERSRAQVEIIRGFSAAGWGDWPNAATLQFSAAKRLEPIDVLLARDTYVGAINAAVSASGLVRGVSAAEVATAARKAPPAAPPERPHDLLLDGMALAITDGLAAGAPRLREAVTAFRTAQLPPEEGIRWFGSPVAAATLLWDWESFHDLSARHVQAARDLGALTMLPWALSNLALAHIWHGDLAQAASLVAETEAINEVTGTKSGLYTPALLAGVRGREDEAIGAIDATIAAARAIGEGVTVKVAQSALATLFNGLGRYDQALAAAREASRHPPHRASHLTLHELVEAATRSGHLDIAADAVQRLVETTGPSGTDWALGVEARSRAPLSTGDTAEALYTEAVERLERSPLRPEAARAHLLYGEWLRRQKRRIDARHQLRAAYEQLSAMGMAAFAERAGQELAATGETVRKRTADAAVDLTPQELQVARLAADGKTNQEIGSQLFISARTVEYHLHKVFTKLAVSSRKELRAKL